MGAYYRQTWWLWLLFMAVFGVISYYVSFIFLIFIPGLAAYSWYFGAVRLSELRKEGEAAARRAAAPSNFPPR